MRLVSSIIFACLPTSDRFSASAPFVFSNSLLSEADFLIEDDLVRLEFLLLRPELGRLDVERLALHVEQPALVRQ